jgi:zinc protease
MSISPILSRPIRAVSSHKVATALLLAIAVTAQLSCLRRKAPEAQPTASPSPTEQERIDQILNRYEEALGGRQAIDALKSYKLTGTFEMGGLTGSLMIWEKEPEKMLTVMEFPGRGTLKKGFDGQTRWVQTPLGSVADSSPQQMGELERDSEVYVAGRIRRLFDTMKLENKARLNGRDMNVIEGKPERGPAERLFFDAENGLLVRWDMARREPKRGTVFVKVHLSDYKEVDGVKVPFNVRFAFESFTCIIKVEQLESNIAIDDTLFNKP